MSRTDPVCFPDAFPDWWAEQDRQEQAELELLKENDPCAYYCFHASLEEHDEFFGIDRQGDRIRYFRPLRHLL